MGFCQARAGPEQPALAVLSEASRINVDAQRLGNCMVARHAVLLATFFLQPDHPSGAPRPEILDLHLLRRANPHETSR